MRNLYVFALVLALSPASGKAQSSAIPASADENIYTPEDTESVRPLGLKLMRNILHDQKAIWTSPFHKEDAALWLGFTAGAAGLIASDHWTSRQLPNTRDQIGVSGNFSKAVYSVIPVAGGYYLAGVLFDNPKARETGVISTEALVDSLITVEVLKLVARRERPKQGDGGGDFFAGGASFPSGHSIESWAVASVVAHEYSNYKVVPFIAYGLAGLVSASRFSAREHFASDIVIGGAMGWFIGRYTYRAHRDPGVHEPSLHSKLAPHIAPRVEPSSGTYGVALNWGR